MRQLNALYRAVEENRLGPWLGDEQFDALTFDDAGIPATRHSLVRQGLSVSQSVLNGYISAIRYGVRQLGIAA